MLEQLFSSLTWLPYHFARKLSRRHISPKHIYLCICDHFEPYWNRADTVTARKRISRWQEELPKVADRHSDSNGAPLQYTFFYPEEEYRHDDLTEMARLCHAGYGAVEVHLHHDNDTADNLRRTLIDYKKRLHEQHGLLTLNRSTGEIEYGFIHGNWALCNSRPDGRWCGVNEEITVLRETGCYADFTMPSAPSSTQTRKINSIYYAQDQPGHPKSHDLGRDVKVGKPGDGLMMIQGPLSLDWRRRKFGLFPRIENSGLLGNFAPTPERVRLWINAGICVKGAPEHLFIKLYTHGAQEDVMMMLFEKQGLRILCDSLAEYCVNHRIVWHYVTGRGMYDAVKLLEKGDG